MHHEVKYIHKYCPVLVQRIRFTRCLSIGKYVCVCVCVCVCGHARAHTRAGFIADTLAIFLLLSRMEAMPTYLELRWSYHKCEIH